MRVLIISAAFPPMRAGEAEHALHLCTHLSSRGADVHLLTTKGQSAPESVSFHIHAAMKSWSWSDALTLVTMLRKIQPDLVLLIYTAWIYQSHPMITFAPTIVKRVLRKASFITQLETIKEENRLQSLATRAIRKCVKYGVGSAGVDYVMGTLYRDSDRLIVLSERHLIQLCTLMPEVVSKTEVVPPPPLIPMCADVQTARDQGRARLALNQDHFLLAYFGYVDQTKGVETLLQAVQLVTKQASNMRLVMIGGGRGTAKTALGQSVESVVSYAREMESLSERLGIADKVTWLPGYSSSSQEASMYLYAADVCVLPFDQGVILSRSSLAAAAAHGLPIITTRGEHLESPFQHEVNVFLCSPKDPDALALAIRRVMSSPDLRLKLTEGAGQLAREWFSWEKAVTRLMEAIQRGP
ncbi:MAG: glycosyltransferase family 4 protein [Nitrospirae bacterium]|nr:glycosyltransferase family 4 protein [Nitrospirota bacterium]MBU6483125.1 glycosyltransferase family 4 protein [Nitrospirota bacterium]MDE3050350.1 glycosyltransferase family 4 protein [Nitrospirota bacterium]MDE3220211.1 glycosyltransferase family 4 protein [Nitrospirota bacterium]